MLSYAYVSNIYLNGDIVAASTENAFFLYDNQSGEFERFSTVQGLSGKKITSLFFHPLTSRYFLAHENGKIKIISEDKSIYHENNLFTSLIPDEDKIIGPVASFENTLFLSMPFGITEYDIQNLEFGDTFYIGTGGFPIQVNDLIVFNDHLYAATQGEGIKFIDIQNPDKSDFTQWQQTGTGNWNHFVIFQNNLYAVQGQNLYHILPNGITQVYTAPSQIMDCHANQSNLFVGLNDRVLKLNNFFSIEEQFVSNAQFPFSLNTLFATDDKLYVGTKRFGILISPVPGNGTFQSVYPNSPILNRPFATDIYDKKIWVVYGDYDQLYNPYPLDSYGISYYSDEKWKHIPYAEFSAKSLTDVKILPSDPGRVFVGSFHDGLLEFRNNQLYAKYDNTNSPIPPIVLGNPPQTYYDFRISPLIFDPDGNLWMFQGLVMNGIHRYDLQGNWQSYSFSSITSTPVNEGTSQMDFDKSGNLWLATHRLGVVGLNPQTGEMIALTEQNGIPYEGSYRNTQAAVVDKDNILWIGTLNGLRILRNPERAFTDPGIQFEKIIIELEELEGQDNQGTELLANTEISEIVVDGANNKWVGTTNSGVYYFSEDGQTTIYHFTEENSPLPGNSVFDISIDPLSGWVLFSTDNGLIGFKGDASEGKENLDSAYVYPNPLNMKKYEQLVIKNLMTGINVKITDIEGNLVYETNSKGGTVTWDLRNFANKKVASGVYLILLTDREGEHTKILKALIIK